MLNGIDSFQNNIYTGINKAQSEAALRRINEQSASAEENKQDREIEQSSKLDLRLEDIRPRANATLEDISLSLNEPSGFEMKGRNSDINALDMEKAVSDMQKDQALMQYQYFVGDTNLFASEDGVVIPK